MPVVTLPPQLAKLVDAPLTIKVDATDLPEAFRVICKKFPGLKAKLFSGNDFESFNRFVRVFVDGRDCGSRVLAMKLSVDSKIKVLIAMAGG